MVEAVFFDTGIKLADSVVRQILKSRQELPGPGSGAGIPWERECAHATLS